MTAKTGRYKTLRAHFWLAEKALNDLLYYEALVAHPAVKHARKLALQRLERRLDALKLAAKEKR